MDYIDWRGDLSFSRETFCPIDPLIFTQLIYSPLENISPENYGKKVSELFPLIFPKGVPEGLNFSNQELFDLWKKVTESPRYGSMRLERFTGIYDTEKQIQFAAAVFSTEDAIMISFRGTDTTVIGWKEDFNMCFESPVPSQTEALKLLESIDFGGKDVYLCGHSKGGNLAMYAGTYCSRQNEITGIYSFDGPGFDDSTMETPQWAAIQDRIFSYLPEESIVGFLMGYCRKYTIVKSDSSGISQHNPFNWHVMGGRFIEASGNSFLSRFLNETMHDFLPTCSHDRRKLLVETLFKIVEVSQAENAQDIIGGLLAHPAELRQVFANLSEEDKKIFMELGKGFSESSGRSLRLLLKSL